MKLYISIIIRNLKHLHKLLLVLNGQSWQLYKMQPAAYRENVSERYPLKQVLLKEGNIFENSE